MVILEKLKSIKGEVSKMKEEHCSVLISSQMTQKELERVMGELKQKEV